MDSFQEQLHLSPDNFPGTTREPGGVHVVIKNGDLLLLFFHFYIFLRGWSRIHNKGGLPKSRGVWGHAPQENFEKFTPLKAILKHFRLRFVSLKASLVTKVLAISGH